MTTTYERLFADEEDEFQRGFAAGVLWQKLREAHDHVDWIARRGDVKMFTRMGQAVGYRVSLSGARPGDCQRMTFISTFPSLS